MTMNDNLKPKKSKLEPELKVIDFNLSEKPFDLRTVDTNILINKLEEMISLREGNIQEQIKKKLLK